jgi:hypothetical protein
MVATYNLHSAKQNLYFQKPTTEIQLKSGSKTYERKILRSVHGQTSVSWTNKTEPSSAQWCEPLLLLAGRHLCFYGAAHAHQLVGKKHCNAFCSLSKCPPPDAHVRGAMETKIWRPAGNTMNSSFKMWSRRKMWGRQNHFSWIFQKGDKDIRYFGTKLLNSRLSFTWNIKKIRWNLRVYYTTHL